METKTSLRQSSVCSADDVFSVFSNGRKILWLGSRSTSSVPTSHGEDNELPPNSPPGGSSYPETINLLTDGFSHASKKSSQNKKDELFLILLVIQERVLYIVSLDFAAPQCGTTL
jgi:hypothetical protein